jgi:hypothetical protein
MKLAVNRMTRLMTQASEEPIAALRERIQRMGHGVSADHKASRNSVVCTANSPG